MKAAKEIRLGFNPFELNKNDPLAKIFKRQGIILKFWALYKHSHITSQYFVTNLIAVQQRLDEHRELNMNPITIGDFADIYDDSREGRMSDYFSNSWLMENWDYLNPSINRKIKFRYRLKSI